MNPLGHPEGACLRYPEPLGNHKDMSHETAARMLLQSTHLASTTPFVWSYVDKPADGTLSLLYLPPPNPYPVDGIRWLDAETRYNVPVHVNGNQTVESSRVYCSALAWLTWQIGIRDL